MEYSQLLALYVLCNDYHSGQSSRGYRLLCLLDRKLRRLNKRYGYADVHLMDGTAERVRKAEFYPELEERYKDKL